jgi:hypothetical protein
MNRNILTGRGTGILYISPLAEEIVVSFEENYLATGEQASLGGMKTGDAGDAGYGGNDFEGDSFSL